MPVLLENLIQQSSKEELYEYGISIAQALGLPVSTWQAGDPTRSLYHILSEILARREEAAAFFCESGFLDYAEGDWLALLAEQVYGVTVDEATHATSTVTLENSGGGVYTLVAGDLTFLNSTSGKTYHSTTGGTLNANSTLDVEVVADEAGSDSSAAADEIDELVTALLRVTVTASTAATGTDRPEDATIRLQCRDKLASLSPNGPAGAYAYVARNSALTETTGITRVRVYAESTTGDVQVYLAGPSGGVSGADRTKAETAIVKWATPLCITPTVTAATNVTVAVTYTVWIYDSVNVASAQVAEDAIEAALQKLFANHPIGGDIIPPATTGSLYKSLIESTIRGVYPECFRVSVSAPAGDTALTNAQVAVLGTITATVNLVEEDA
jgi:hypothetical protein